MKVYGSRISYYTGKLETYLRYCGIEYELFPTVGNEKKLKAGAGVVQMPVVELGDGRWMTDTTPILRWLDAQQNMRSIYPDNEGLGFLALLIEDYADEWLWRPAMHYRWSYPVSRVYAAEALYRELIKGIKPFPRWMGLSILKLRQYFGFVRWDGVNRSTRPHVEQSYFEVLNCLEAIFKKRPFILGERPTISDFAMMGPMFRHFSMDPDPAEIMRSQAPAVYEWVARMWHARKGDFKGKLIQDVNPPLLALIKEISQTHLVQLRENAKAYSKRQRHFDQTVQGCYYGRLPVSRYRVWCLEALRSAYQELTEQNAQRVRTILSEDAGDILWSPLQYKTSGYNTEGQAPFNRAINVYGTGLPRP